MDTVHDGVMTYAGFNTVYAISENGSGLARSQHLGGSAMEMRLIGHRLLTMPKAACFE
jgi:hypothetical protein